MICIVFIRSLKSDATMTSSVPAGQKWISKEPLVTITSAKAVISIRPNSRCCTPDIGCSVESNWQDTTNTIMWSGFASLASVKTTSTRRACWSVFSLMRSAMKVCKRSRFTPTHPERLPKATCIKVSQSASETSIFFLLGRILRARLPVIVCACGVTAINLNCVACNSALAFFKVIFFSFAILRHRFIRALSNTTSEPLECFTCFGSTDVDPALLSFTYRNMRSAESDSDSSRIGASDTLSFFSQLKLNHKRLVPHAGIINRHVHSSSDSEKGNT